ncbi:MAG: hypothetical protein JNL19_00325 [Burkholderiales bacterium]|nr:hypothetical protein [Burkholderiales bacterium]
MSTLRPRFARGTAPTAACLIVGLLAAWPATAHNGDGCDSDVASPTSASVRGATSNAERAKATPTTPTVANFVLAPSVINTSATGTVRLTARMDGPTPTTLQLVSNWGVTYALTDNGANGDVTAGDGIYTTLLPVQQILSRHTATDVFRVELGFLDTYAGSARVSRNGVTAQVRGPEIAAATVKPLSGSAQMSRYVLNIAPAALYRTHDVALPDIAAVASAAYQYLTDEFDFLNIVFDKVQPQNRYHFATRNSVAGTGQSSYNSNAQYGGASRLVGITVFPISDYFDGASAAHQHEIGHQWMAFLKNASLTSGSPHWPASTMAADLMGLSIPGSGAGGQFNCQLTAEGNGLRVTPLNYLRAMSYNPLDLYLMGMIAASDVPDQWVVTDSNWVNNWPALCDGRVLSSGFSRLTANDVVAANGPRTPATGAAQRTFRVATVVVSEGLLSADAMSYYSYFAQRMEARERGTVHEGLAIFPGAPFFVATGGRGALIATVDSAVTLPTQVTAIEYFHPQLNYYFITSRDNEKSLLDAVPAWTKTGASFKMMLNPDAALGGVTRFYFDKIAKNNTRGSHFYTTNPADVAVLQALNPGNAALPQKPVNEGIDSFAWRATGSGVSATCPSGTAPLYRLFRGSKFPDDPNHRFTTSLAVYNQFVGLGWDGEGVAFCVPN